MSEITIPALPADLPEDFQLQDIIAPNGADIGKPVQRGYNYLMQLMNETQRAVMKMAEESNSAFETKKTHRSHCHTYNRNFTPTMRNNDANPSVADCTVLLCGWEGDNMDINVKITEQLTDLLKQHGIHIAPEIQNDITKTLNEYSIIHREDKKRPNLDRRIEQFLAVKRLDGLAERTLGNYRMTLNLFAKQTEKNTAQIQTDDIREYIVYLTTQRELKDSSLCTHINTLRSFFAWLLAEGLIRKNPMLKIKTKKLDKRNARHALAPEEMERLRDVARIIGNMYCWNYITAPDVVCRKSPRQHRRILICRSVL